MTSIAYADPLLSLPPGWSFCAYDQFLLWMFYDNQPYDAYRDPKYYVAAFPLVPGYFFVELLRPEYGAPRANVRPISASFDTLLAAVAATKLLP